VSDRKLQMRREESSEAPVERKRRDPRAGGGRSGSGRPPRRTEGRGDGRSAPRRKPGGSRPNRDK